ncbi:hypothetical protein D6764_03280 [Candidatus Woesearchaeota archaeon]|nr:MAG: hypothetical protein D6764_03280 [Candidatus Woesearchaeota archaeon]
MLKKILSSLKAGKAKKAEKSPLAGKKDDLENNSSAEVPPPPDSSPLTENIEPPAPSEEVIKALHNPGIEAPEPSGSVLDDKPLPVELVRLPGEDPVEEIFYSLKSAYNLIKSGNFEQAGMLYDIIDVAFKNHSSSFPDSLKHDLKRYYDEITLYLWINDAYELALKRRLSQLKYLLPMISSLSQSVARKTPIDRALFTSAMKKLDSALALAGFKQVGT